MATIESRTVVIAVLILIPEVGTSHVLLEETSRGRKLPSKDLDGSTINTFEQLLRAIGIQAYTNFTKLTERGGLTMGHSLMPCAAAIPYRELLLPPMGYSFTSIPMLHTINCLGPTASIVREGEAAVVRKRTSEEQQRTNMS